MVQLGQSSAADVDFVLIVDNQISGHVLDSQGKPVKDVCVQPEPATGETSHYFYISKCSEVDGSYRLKDMPSGQYRIRAEPWTGGKRLGTKFFYPGTTERTDAAVVTIGSGEHLDGFAISVPK